MKTSTTANERDFWLASFENDFFWYGNPEIREQLGSVKKTFKKTVKYMEKIGGRIFDNPDDVKAFVRDCLRRIVALNNCFRDLAQTKLDELEAN